jgi:hypothetical protein
VQLPIDNREIVEVLQRFYILTSGWPNEAPLKAVAALDPATMKTENHTQRVVDTTLELASMMESTTKPYHYQTRRVAAYIGKMEFPIKSFTTRAR